MPFMKMMIDDREMFMYIVPTIQGYLGIGSTYFNFISIIWSPTKNTWLQPNYELSLLLHLNEFCAASGSNILGGSTNTKPRVKLVGITHFGQIHM